MGIIWIETKAGEGNKGKRGTGRRRSLRMPMTLTGQPPPIAARTAEVGAGDWEYGDGDNGESCQRAGAEEGAGADLGVSV